MDNKFIIITPFYNVEEWVKYCLRSVSKQGYKNYSHYLIDDLSTDSSTEFIENEALQNKKIKLIKNTTKKYALKNISDTLKEINPADEDIIVILDGDDWLAAPDVLEKLNKIYNDEDCWMTYGSYVEFPSKIKGKFAKQIPEHIINNNSYRESPWQASHLRTFKYGLWKKIKQEDLKDSLGNYYEMAWDLAFMFPMLEMSGKKAHYVKNIMYVYNVNNPINDHKVDHSKQLRLDREIRQKQKYKKL